MFFKKKKPDIITEPDKPKPKEPVTITFSASDDIFERADKLFRYMNLWDHTGLPNILAKGLHIYAKLDAALLETKNQTKE